MALTMDLLHLALKQGSMKKHLFWDLGLLDFLLDSAANLQMVVQVAMGYAGFLG